MKDTYCPKCRTHLILTDSIENSKFIKCSSCKISFENPHHIKPKKSPLITIKKLQVIGLKPVYFLLLFVLIIVAINISKKHTENKYEIFHATNIVKMTREGGVYYVPIYVNGVLMRFIFDTGASSISISLKEALLLIKTGKLTKNDIIGSERYQDATGGISIGTVIILRQIQIGNKTLYNVEASVVDNFNAPLLLGQSALAKFGKISIDYNNNEIKFE